METTLNQELQNYSELKTRLDKSIKHLIDNTIEMPEYDELNNYNKNIFTYEDTDLDNLRERRKRLINHLIIFQKKHPEYSYSQEITTDSTGSKYTLTVIITKHAESKKDNKPNTENS